MTDLTDKIEKEMDYMELNNRSYKMGLIKFGPWLEQMKHHIKKLKELNNAP